MVIALFGESCTGKSTIAGRLAQRLGAEIITGKDYLKLAKSEAEATQLFREKLRGDGRMIYVISEPEQLALLPEACVRVLVCASLETIRTRFAARMHGQLPPPVATMLERKHGRFEPEAHDLRIDTDVIAPEDACAQICALAGE